MMPVAMAILAQMAFHVYTQRGWQFVYRSGKTSARFPKLRGDSNGKKKYNYRQTERHIERHSASCSCMSLTTP